MSADIQTSFRKLKNYCEKEQFKGWDPFDGLNSQLFQSLPLIRKSLFFKLSWIQIFKINPVNLRKLAIIRKEYNPKGLALFLSGYCYLYKIQPEAEFLETINWLAEKIISMKSDGHSGACWGYNFDWQNRAFFQPKFSPTVVVSTFVGYALLDAYDITKNEYYKNTALSISDFIVKDLNRTYDTDDDFAFSYSPYDSTQVINATLLGSRMLALIYHHTRNAELINLARKSVAYSCKLQRSDGSWVYGNLPVQQWADSFHTGYNLECIAEYQKYSGDQSFDKHLNSGLDYYLRSFFLPSGIPKYYNNSQYPVDIHSSSQLVITLKRLDRIQEYKSILDKVLTWTINNMQDQQGYFYYQKRKWFTNKIPYMRWSEAWMFYALTVYLSSIKNQ
jgi:hypothetical protein